MTEIPFDLGLFSEGGGASGEGAQASGEGAQASGKGSDDVGSEGSAECIGGVPTPSADTSPTGSGAGAASVPDAAYASGEEGGLPSDGKAPSESERTAVSRLCEALGLDGAGEDPDGLYDLIRARRQKSELEEILKEAAAAREYEKLSSEAVAFARKVEGFDLNRELGDRRFGALLHAGFSVEEAFRAVHFDELLANAVEDAKRCARESVLEKARLFADRPDENGAGGVSPAKTTADVRSLTGKGIRDILRRVEKGAKVKF